MNRGGKLAPEVQRVLFVKNLRFVKLSLSSPTNLPPRWHKDNSYNVSSEELFDLFGKFGPIRYVFCLVFRFIHMLTERVKVKFAKE